MKLLLWAFWIFVFADIPIGLQADKMDVSVGELTEETGFYQSIAVTEDSPLFKRQSKYQSIEVYRSEYYGRILILDGVLQLTERDADSYNEMMAHMAMMQHKNPKRALVIGGGDGYVLSEVSPYSIAQSGIQT